MRILGIDPGSRATGFGVIDSDGRHSRHVASGCIRTESQDFNQRLREIYLGLCDVLDSTKPDEVAVEQVFLAKNAQSALKLGQARGAAIAAVVVAGLRVNEYSARSVKLAVVGTGGAEKEQVQHMVRILLGVSGKMALDESDALAIALCHAHSSTGIGRLMRQA